MWTQVWPIADLQRIDRETRKIMVENGARHPLASTDQLYIPRSSGGRGLKSVESEYKLIKIKAAVKLCANTDPTLKLVREFEERAVEKGPRSMLKDASGFARELGIELELEHPEPVGRTENGELVDKKKIGVFAKKALYTKRRQGIEEQSWQGKLVTNPNAHVPVFADQTEVRANRIDGRIVNKARKTVTLLEMSCPWVDNRDHKDEEKTMKYAPLRLELKRQHPGFNIVQYNIIVDVLGGYSKDLKKSRQGACWIRKEYCSVRQNAEVCSHQFTQDCKIFENHGLKTSS